MIPIGNPNPDLLRGRQEIADYFGVNPKTLDRWRKKYAKSDPMPMFAPGREIQADRRQLDKWRERRYT